MGHKSRQHPAPKLKLSAYTQVHITWCPAICQCNIASSHLLQVAAHAVCLFSFIDCVMPIQLAARSKALVCGRLLSGCGFVSHLNLGCLSLVSVVFCQVEDSATSRSLDRISPTHCGVSECDQTPQ